MKLHSLKHFFLETIWSIRLNSLSFPKAILLKVCRIVVLTIRFFLQNRCALHAASLTYYTLLAIVPVLALMFGIARGYGFDGILREKLVAMLHGNQELAAKFLEFTESAISNAGSGIITGVGVLFLIWTAVKLLASIEKSFNGIWGVHRGRAWSRKFCDYLTLLVICPFLMVVMATTSDMMSGTMKNLVSGLPFSAFWESSVDFIMGCLHLVSIWFIFYFIYAFVPNTRVTFRAAFIAGVLVGTAYALLQSLYVFVQMSLSSYNAVYGSFAAVPFLLILMNVGWTLTIFGAQLAFAIQNVNLYELEPGSGMRPLSPRRYKICALQIAHAVACNFVDHGKPLSAVYLSKKLEIPVRATRSIIYDLCEVGIFSQLMSDNSEDDTYQLALPPDEVTVQYILKKLDENGADLPLPPEDLSFEQFYADTWAKQDSVPLYRLNAPRKC